MRKHGLLCKKRRKFRPQTTDSNHGFRVYPNPTRELEVTELNQLWVADITYVSLLKGFAYLAVILDAFSRKCIGWELNNSLCSDLSLNALYRALDSRAHLEFKELVHHSDQGIQYACNDYTNLLEEHGIRISISCKANPYDNAYVESFIKTLKHEEVHMTEYEDFNDAYKNIEKSIEGAYNKRRLHSSIGYRPPAKFEEQYALKEVSG
jgi:transposase InsO family protein